MKCAICNAEGENIASPNATSPVFVHAETGACWNPVFHAFVPLIPHVEVEVVRHSFSRFVNGEWKWPWEVP